MDAGHLALSEPAVAVAAVAAVVVVRSVAHLFQRLKHKVNKQKGSCTAIKVVDL